MNKLFGIKYYLVVDCYAPQRRNHIVAALSVCPSVCPIPCPANNFKTAVCIKIKLGL